MNKQKSIFILIIIIILAAVILAMYFKVGQKAVAPTLDTQPAVDTGRYMPELNNTLETSVTVINPQDQMDDNVVK